MIVTEPTFKIALVNPRPTRSFCDAAGVRRYYTDWDLPEEITSAIGAGASGRIHGSLDAQPPIATCVRGYFPGSFIALRVDFQ